MFVSCAVLKNLIKIFEENLITDVSVWPDTSVSFLKTSDEYGCLSNMYLSPVKIGEIDFYSREHLYQCCKAPDKDMFNKLLEIRSPVGMKRYFHNAVPNQQHINRARVMLLVNLIHYKQQPSRLNNAFDVIGDKWIVEISFRLPYWGAKPEGNSYVGINTLGQVLSFIMTYRKEINKVAEEEIVKLLFSEIPNLRQFIG